MHIYIHTHTCTHTDIMSNSQTQSCVRTYILTRLQAGIHTYTPKHIDIYRHRHTQAGAVADRQVRYRGGQADIQTRTGRQKLAHIRTYRQPYTYGHTGRQTWMQSGRHAAIHTG